MDTIAYIDAFNLYFGALKPNQCKWLDLESWLDRQFPKKHNHSDQILHGTGEAV